MTFATTFAYKTKSYTTDNCPCLMREKACTG